MFALSMLVQPALAAGPQAPPVVHCDANQVAFDGACRGLSEVAAWGASDARVVAVSGCKRVGACSNVILYEEIKVTFKLRALVLSEVAAVGSQRR